MDPAVRVNNLHFPGLFPGPTAGITPKDNAMIEQKSTGICSCFKDLEGAEK